MNADDAPVSDGLTSGAGASAALGERPGDLIGRYRLLQLLGEGGMGRVWMAEQEEPFRRRVALKVIKLGMDTKQVVGRFDAERQALALMDHPNIAKVFDAGATEAGRPFFVMELVEGVPITRYCDEHRLNTEERLRIFTDVCHAIQHAHQKGIIHRDLKPSNILVAVHDGTPAPKVIDFGIAKATAGQSLADRTVFTAFEQLVGTPAYMSPEQAEISGLDIDTRSDIYSLGVLLYELLTGRTPFDTKELVRAGLDEMRRVIREQEPPRPSVRLSTLADKALSAVAQQRQCEPPRLIYQVRGDLDWIVMKCLEKDRNRRYETANGLANDIQCHLSNEPVVACPQSHVYRLGKLIRRNKLAFAAVGAIVGTLVLGSVVSVWQAVRATRAREAALRAEVEARAVLGFFQDKVLRAARPEGQDGGLGHAVTLRAAIAAAEPGIAKSFSNQPNIEASIRFTIGVTYLYLGEPTNAIAQCERALALRQANFGPDHPDTLKAMSNLAASYHEAGRWEEALKLREQVLQLRQAALGPDHPETLSAMNNLAISYSAAARLEEALKLREQTLQLMKSELGPDHPDTLSAMNNLALSYDVAGRLPEALKVREQTLQLMKAKLGADHPDALNAMNNLANSYYSVGLREEALKVREQTLQLMKAKLGLDHPTTLKAMNNLAISYSTAARLEEALKLREQILQLTKAKLGPDHIEAVKAMGNLANSYYSVGLRERALELFEQTLQLTKVKLGPDHPDTLSAMNNLATSYAAAGRREDALKLREQMLQLRQAKLGPDHPDTLKAMGNLASSYYSGGRREEALKLREQTLELTKAKLGPDHPDTLEAMGNLAASYSAAGRREDALTLSEQTLQLMKTRLGPDHPDTLSAMGSLANSYIGAGRREEALALREQTLQLTKAKLGPDHPDTLCAMGNLANSYNGAGRRDEALNIFEQTLQLMKAKLGPDHPYTLSVMHSLAAAYSAAGRGEEALKLRQQILQLAKTNSTHTVPPHSGQ